MKNCEYYIHAEEVTKKSYEELLDWLDDKIKDTGLNDWQSFEDIVFSVASILDKIAKQLMDKNKEYHVIRKARNSLSGVIDGEAEVEDSDSFSINGFLESDLCAINGKRIVTQKDDEEYKANFILQFTKNMGMSLELAEKEFERLQKGNDIIVEDAVALHSILTSSHIVSSASSAVNSFESDFRNVQTSRFEGNSLLADQLFNGLKSGYLRNIVKRNRRVIKNINLKSKLIGIDKDIVGHIDYITISLDGTLHLYLYKVSSQRYNEWPSAKREKFKALLVFLKYMLAENGFNVKNMSLNIIPIYLKYNDDFSKILSIRVDDPRQYSARLSDGSYALENYDRLVSRFLKDNYVPNENTNDIIDLATKDIRKIFPSLNIKKEGISKSAEEWVRMAPDCDPYNTEPLAIIDVHEPNHGYDLVVRKKDGTTETIVIKSDRLKNRNKELHDAVVLHLEYLSDNKGYLLNTIKNAIKEGYDKGKTDVFADLKGLPSPFLSSIFSKYFAHTINEKKERVYDWKLLEDLSDANVIMFLHKNGLVDVISLSSFNLNVSPTLKPGATTVLGSYCYDTLTTAFKGDFGNIELIRTLTLLNLMAPSFGEGFKLGKIQVINTQSETLRAYSASYLNRSLFLEILNVINKENPDSKIKNNLNGCKFVDEVGVLLNEYLDITSAESMTEAQAYYYTSLGFDILQLVSKDSREYALFNIMSNIYNERPGFGRSEEVVLNTARHGDNPKDRNLARLLLLTAQAYLAVRGEQAMHQSTLASIDALTFTAMHVPDINVRIVAENLLITHDTISSEFMEQFSPMNKVFEDFFDAVGYSQLEGVTVGDEARQFSNLYDPDSDLMKFKNPYDNSNDLSPAERELLKKVLFAMAKITSHDNFLFESYNNPKLPEWILSHQEYLWVPLERASKATTRLTFKGIKAAMDYTKKLLTNSRDRFEDAMEGLLSEEANMLDEGFKMLQLLNTFSLSMPIGRDFKYALLNRRQLLKRGKSFYETNLKNIFIDYLFKSIATELYNKLLISSKALLLSMHLTNDFGGNEETLKREIEHVKDYLGVNVFLRSIMEPKSKKVMSFIQPIKSKVTNMLLMGNVISFMRDITQGVLENTVRSAIKFNTDISPKSIAAAYAYVTTHSTSNARAVNLLSKLCLRYRLSNTDVGRISARAKSSRNGIFNWDNLLYGTLRSPDFLNRMVLFVARCMEDGCWEGWSINKDTGDLEYDWRKDKRFNLLATDDNSDPEAYAKQRSLYISKIREYNIEHPEKEDLDLSLKTDLPWPYSNREIVSIRGVADNIYGSYDKSKKGMYENWAIGVSFGMFTTWFNGIYVNYFGKAGLYATNKLKQVLDTDPETGLLLYYDPKTKQITVNPVGEDGTPNDIIWKNIPIITLGIFPTIGTLYRILRNDGKDALMEYLKSNEAERANLRKLISDLLISGLFLLLFKGILSGEYDDYKKDMKNNSLALNLLVEILYKSSSRSYDSFLGPINVIQQLGDNMNPPYYSAPLKLLQDTYGAVFGEKLFITLMTNNLGIARAFKDTYKAELNKGI